MHLIKQRKQNLINQGNAKESRKQIAHTYKVNDLVLVKKELSSKYGKDAYNGPWAVPEVQDNRMVEVSKGPVSEIYNIQNITPYVSQSLIMGKCAINDVVLTMLAKLAYINQ